VWPSSTSLEVNALGVTNLSSSNEVYNDSRDLWKPETSMPEDAVREPGRCRVRQTPRRTQDKQNAPGLRLFNTVSVEPGRIC